MLNSNILEDNLLIQNYDTDVDYMHQTLKFERRFRYLVDSEIDHPVCHLKFYDLIAEWVEYNKFQGNLD